MKSSSKPAVGKRELKKVEEGVSKKVATVLNVTESDFETWDNFELTDDIQTKADDLDCFVDCMKEKLEVSKRREQLQILTVVPKSWSVWKAAKEFSVSKNKIKKLNCYVTKNAQFHLQIWFSARKSASKF